MNPFIQSFAGFSRRRNGSSPDGLRRSGSRGRVRLTLPGLLVCAAVAAQEPVQPRLPLPPPPPGVAPAAEADPLPAEGHETERETVVKCLRDLTSEDAAVRHRATLILGKYPANPMARTGILRGLSDDDVVVRRTALVSVSEWPRVEPPADMAVLELLSDDDVHIRRIASSMLPELAMGSRAFLALGVPAPRAPADGFSRRLATALVGALADEDDGVRKNVLSVLPYVSLERVTPEQLVPCMQSADRDVRILALRAYGRLAETRPVSPAPLDDLAREEDPVVRREVASVCASLGDAGLARLRKFVEDPAAEVRVEAVRQLLRRRDPGAIGSAGDLIADRRLPVDDRQDLLGLLMLYPEEGPEILLRTAREGDPSLRAEAVRTLAGIPGTDVPLEFFFPFLEADSADVRGAAAYALTRRGAELSPEQVAQVYDSPHADVRLASVRLAARLSRDVAAELLADACLDDDNRVRAEAIRRCALMQADGWEFLVRQSLKDPDPEIREAAVDVLMLTVRLPVARRMLESHMAESRDPAEVGRIRAALQRADAPGATRIDAEGRVLPVPPEPRLVPPIRER